MTTVAVVACSLLYIVLVAMDLSDVSIFCIFSSLFCFASFLYTSATTNFLIADVICLPLIILAAVFLVVLLPYVIQNNITF